MIADAVGGLAVRDLPGDLALVQIDRRDAPVGRLDDRQPLDAEAASAAFAGGIESCAISHEAPSAGSGCRAHRQYYPNSLARPALDVIDVGDFRIVRA